MNKNAGQAFTKLASLATTLASIILLAPQADALNWTVNDTTALGSIPITGSFTIDDESPPNDMFPGDLDFPLLNSNMTVGGVIYSDVSNPFTSIDVDDLTGLINSITIGQDNGSGGCSLGIGCTLTLNFASPLSPTGGTVDILNTSSVDQQGLSSGLSGNGTATTNVPEPMTIMGTIIAFVLGTFFSSKQTS
jgi:hypothetical protein